MQVVACRESTLIWFYLTGWEGLLTTTMNIFHGLHSYFRWVSSACMIGVCEMFNSYLASIPIGTGRQGLSQFLSKLKSYDKLSCTKWTHLFINAVVLMFGMCQAYNLWACICTVWASLYEWTKSVCRMITNWYLAMGCKSVGTMTISFRGKSNTSAKQIQTVLLAVLVPLQHLSQFLLPLCKHVCYLVVSNWREMKKIFIRSESNVLGPFLA